MVIFNFRFHLSILKSFKVVTPMLFACMCCRNMFDQCCIHLPFKWGRFSYELTVGTGSVIVLLVT